ncbi:hypothetical protein [Nocardiopsis sp. ATB16-24]|uniref:hypothetical protein n=1 Tax=Nocardiopsis sp. ATB16-24 TaxID=3019555 RepID=UPI00255722BC|nr:hypothetical protein [Nocardiopsis sp. ATB16-24]
MGWEPSVDQTLNLYPDFDVLVSTEDLNLENSWQFILGVNDDISDEDVEALLGALNAAADKMRQDPELADSYGERQGYTDDTVSRVLEDESLPIDARPLDDEIRESLLADLTTAHEAGALTTEPSADVFR